LSEEIPFPAADRTLRLVVVEDHPLYRYALEHWLGASQEIEVVGAYGDGVSGMRGIRALQPDVAVLDLELPQMSGLEILRELADEPLRTRTLVLSAHAERERAAEALAAGATGYVAKDLGGQEIRDAVLMVARGERVVPLSLQAAPPAIAAAPLADVVLTPREQEILTLAAQGLSRDEVGSELHVSPATVKAHLGHVYRKLGVSTRAAAVATAVRSGLL
jgi:two-component system nitrate/nitrite response regulator NarL